MWKATSAVLMFLLLLAVSNRVYPQATGASRLSKDYIENFGAKLRLGMTKAEAEESLSGAQIIKSSENGWVVTAGQSVSTVHFENGRLSFADRTWHSKDNDIVDALYGAVTYFNNDGHSMCTAFADTVPDPQNSYERVWIRCGDKSILLARGMLEGKTFEEVDEHLGVLRQDSK